MVDEVNVWELLGFHRRPLRPIRHFPVAVLMPPSSTHQPAHTQTSFSLSLALQTMGLLAVQYFEILVCMLITCVCTFLGVVVGHGLQLYWLSPLLT